MSSSHLDRTGFRHLVMGIATITTLIGAMWASSSFLGPISGKSLASTPTLDDTYSRISHYTVPIIALNSSVAFIIIVMSLIVDWHFDIPLPAYMEFAWVGVAWCIQLVSTIITASVASPSALCRTNDLAPSETWSMGALCSNCKAVLASSVIALTALTLHLSWHLLFRLCHRATLANRPTTPVNLWTTPLPRKYPINPYERGQRRLPKTSIALGKARIPPADCCASTPVTAHTTYSRPEEVARGYARPAAAGRVSADDLEKAITSDNASIASSKVGRMTPPGLDIAAESRRSRATEN
ncbi:hypothetical protein FRC08_008506 [Ceratobasidium sp. 394]|nr:hypothetical protein FRC08_008506 [Ceratobasidium sp. 394]KAG9094323.1 hypothetical protein FS749_012690 [Ceratobasidium sp. UAMH 11750]